jgi:hypothetical protein
MSFILHVFRHTSLKVSQSVFCLCYGLFRRPTRQDIVDGRKTSPPTTISEIFPLRPWRATHAQVVACDKFKSLHTFSSPATD